MPYIKPIKVVRRPLPSDPEYWVDMKDHIVYGELKRVTRDAVAIARDGSTQVDSATATDNMLLAYIVDWNLDDEHGKKLPLTAASLEQMDSNDLNHLATFMTADRAKKDDERKN